MWHMLHRHRISNYPHDRTLMFPNLLQASTRLLKGDDKAIFLSRSKDCENTATPPAVDIRGCS